MLGRLEARHGRCAPLAGKSTLNRLEHGSAEADRYRRIAHDGAAIEALFVDLFLDAHAQAPKEIVLDLDATDDPLHGHQEGRFFHGYYDCHCYLPLYVFCGRICWRRSSGAPTSTPRLARSRRWRASSAGSRPLAAGADRPARRRRLRAGALDGLVRGEPGRLPVRARANPRLVERIHIELAWAEHDAEASGRAARRFADFRWTTRES